MAVSDVCEQLREAVARSGKTLYRIAKDAGVSQPVLARFVRRERDVRAETFAKLAAALGLELRPKKTQSKNGGRQ
jgi:transcriptional regulator with XRE-family HTH domain